MMRYRNDAKFIGGDLIDDAVRKSAEEITASGTAKNRPEHGIFQDDTCCPLELGHEREAKFDIGLRRIEGRRIMQLGKRWRNNNEPHFRAARTWASACAIGIT